MLLKTKDTDKGDFYSSATEFLNEVKLLQIVKSANILVDLFGFQKAFDRIKPKEQGTQIEMFFPALKGSITFTLVSDKEKFHAIDGQPKDPVGKIVIDVEEKDILRLISEILVLKDNLIGLMKIAPKVLKGQLKLKGSWKAAIKLCRCMMIGKHKMYKGQL
jgi:hypothetical protein